ncbi:Zn-ribbon domain-containing OB-fold protein [Bacillus sp. Marseille-P3661]|uniref:Zn-ribbon domain-containing OB-fold protein n=1 Tax=Bacillus sp. Marseille-P3661 TaxID=1936234 RepID=UPI002155B7F7|nr:OB-fold domain-containing protein [Bacillus sp. Marseille-P3661]
MGILDKLKDLGVPGPTITPVTQPFWDGITRGEFLVQECGDCEKSVFYPRTHCPHCWSNRLEWKSASGKARLKTWSVVQRPGHPGWQAVTPYVLGIVELEEGPSMMTQLLVESPNQLKIGDHLQVRYVQVNDVTLPFFEKV